jgi:acyl-CoA synthetase (NDP forming)
VSTSHLPAAERGVYRHGELARLIHPGRVAILGASARAGAFGERTLSNLARFTGAVDLINPRYESLSGRSCYPSISALPQVPDCVVICVPFDAVEGALAECVAAGVGGAVVYASGYAETGLPERIALQQRLQSIVKSSRTRLLGPNCLGYYNFLNNGFMMFGRVVAATPNTTQLPRVGVVSQSGAIGMALSQAIQRGMSVSHMLTAGNSADVGIADLIAFLAEDPGCQSIACVFEGADSPPRLFEALELAASAEKPVVLLKAGQSNAGAEAALSHTGSLAGEYAFWKAACEARGAIMVDDLEAITEMASFLAKAGRPKAAGAIAVVTSGGAGVISADKGAHWGVPMPQPAGETLALLEENLPEFAARRNPCDVTAQVLNDDGPMRRSAGALLDDPSYGAAVVPHPFADEVGLDRIHLWHELGQQHGKIICYIWCSEWLEGPGVREVEASPYLALFRSMDRCFAALAAWQRREQMMTVRKEERALAIIPDARSVVSERLAALQQQMLTEREAKALLSQYGVPVVDERLATDGDAAIAAADAIGYPVVLKLESPDLPHKTEHGLVMVNVADATEVAEAFATLVSRASQLQAPRVNGVLVQRMVPRGVEIMIGGRSDPQFGALVVLSLGGVLVEAIGTGVEALAPVGPKQARAMIEQLQGLSLLKGFRDLPAVDLDALAQTISQISHFLADHAGSVRELDVNPLICRGAEICAVDALLVTRHGER